METPTEGTKADETTETHPPYAVKNSLTLGSLDLSTPRLLRSLTPQSLDFSTPRLLDFSTPLSLSTPRFLDPSTPALGLSTPLDPSTPRHIEPSSPPLFDSPTPQLLDVSTPRPLDTSALEFLDSPVSQFLATTPPPLDSSTPRHIDSSTPRLLDSTPQRTDSSMAQTVSFSIRPGLYRNVAIEPDSIPVHPHQQSSLPLCLLSRLLGMHHRPPARCCYIHCSWSWISLTLASTALSFTQLYLLLEIYLYRDSPSSSCDLPEAQKSFIVLCMCTGYFSASQLYAIALYRSRLPRIRQMWPVEVVMWSLKLIGSVCTTFDIVLLAHTCNSLERADTQNGLFSCVWAGVMLLTHFAIKLGRRVMGMNTRDMGRGTHDEERKRATSCTLEHLATYKYSHFRLTALGEDIGKDPAACPICLVDWHAEDEIKITPCGHAFHTDCIRQWLSTKPTCALCRRDVSAPGQTA